MKPTRVFILASQALFAQGAEKLLTGQRDIEVVGVATVGPEAIATAQAAAPDAVVVEATGEGQGSLVAQVLDALPGARVIGLTLEDNRLHTYTQQTRQGACVEDLVEAIRAPGEWSSRSPETLRLFVSYQGHYGQRILENVRRYAPKTWKVDAWPAPATLPQVVDEPLEFLPLHLPPADLLLALGESPSAAQLLPGIVERTGARAVVAPVDNVDWLPDGLARQLSVQLTTMDVVAVFPKPFCSLTEDGYNVHRQAVSYDDPWIAEFAHHFGRPQFHVRCEGQVVTHVEVKRDSACGCARDVARQLAGVGVEDAVIQAGLLHHHYPCLATMRVDPGLGEPLIQAAGDMVRQAIESEIATAAKQAASGKQQVKSGK